MYTSVISNKSAQYVWDALLRESLPKAAAAVGQPDEVMETFLQTSSLA